MSEGDEILDEIDESKQLVLFSKLSVLLAFFLFSPLLGGFLYCYNLSLSHQKGKIVSTYITILFIFLLSLFPLMGFKLVVYGFDFVPIIASVITTAILLGPFWDKHFSNLKYRTKFPTKHFLIMLGIILLATVYEYWLVTNSSVSKPISIFYYLFNFPPLSMMMILMYLLLGRIIYILIFDQKKTKKANLKNDIPAEN